MQRTFNRAALRIAGGYVVVASLWIIFSDYGVKLAFGDTALIGWAQTLKGWFFVAVTGGLLYMLMQRALGRVTTAACKDSLTGLPNRLAFTEELQRRCRRAGTRSDAFSVTILDIDHFTDLNDVQSHGQGDRVLMLLGDELTRLLEPDWYVARLGGDEFGLISPVDKSSVEVTGRVSDLQNEVMRRSVHRLLQDQRISAGTSHFPHHGRDRHDLLRHADMALTQAKNQGRDQHVVYRDQIKYELMERLSLLKDLRQACEEGAFTLVYQPQWSVKKRCWVGAEVLIRWQHPQRGFVPPDLFIPLAEREGLIAPITEFVVQRALQELEAMGICRELLPSLSINLSHPVLLNEGTMNTLFSVIEARGAACPYIIMEITETATMEDLDATLVSMQQWCHGRCNFSIDDFGTGYSSLARLKQMPIAELKIDRSFIQGIPREQNDAVITKAILGMAQTLSLEIVAEGVETEEQARFLTDYGCSTLQGYWLARPMPIEQLHTLLQDPAQAQHVNMF